MAQEKPKRAVVPNLLGVEAPRVSAGEKDPTDVGTQSTHSSLTQTTQSPSLQAEPQIIKGTPTGAHGPSPAPPTRPLLPQQPSIHWESTTLGGYNTAKGCFEPVTSAVVDSPRAGSSRYNPERGCFEPMGTPLHFTPIPDPNVGDPRTAEMLGDLGSTGEIEEFQDKEKGFVGWGGASWGRGGPGGGGWSDVPPDPFAPEPPKDRTMWDRTLGRWRHLFNSDWENLIQDWFHAVRKSFIIWEWLRLQQVGKEADGSPRIGVLKESEAAGDRRTSRNVDLLNSGEVRDTKGALEELRLKIIEIHRGTECFGVYLRIGDEVFWVEVKVGVSGGEIPGASHAVGHAASPGQIAIVMGGEGELGGGTGGKAVVTGPDIPGEPGGVLIGLGGNVGWGGPGYPGSTDVRAGDTWQDFEWP